MVRRACPRSACSVLGAQSADLGCEGVSPKEDVAGTRRYRKFRISEGLALVVRCELDGVLTYKGEELLLSIKALNEFDPKVTGARTGLHVGLSLK